MSHKQLALLDLFSGIGGFSLGLERSGFFKTVAFCEIEPFPRKVLKKHWPNVPIYEDIRTLTADALRRDGIAVDAICGGFPCQDISVAGNGAGLAGERSGLWSEYARIIGELRPRFVIVENVAALLGRGLNRVLGDLASLGFDAEWHCIPASAVGAPHRRDRLWIVAYAKKLLGNGREHYARSRKKGKGSLSELGDRSCHENVADTSCPDVEGQWLSQRIQTERSSFGGSSWWLSEPDVGRVANGVPSRVDRLKGLGNAVVPQIPELIGRAIGAML